MFKWFYHKEIFPHTREYILCGIVALFIVLRIPSLVEPEWYGDEGIYQAIGMALQQGRLLYQGIWDNKPPLLYIYYALTGGNLFLIRLLSLLFGVAAVIGFYLLARALYKKDCVATYVSTLVFAILFGLPLLEGNIANAENFMLAPIIFAFYVVITSLPHVRMRHGIIAGLLLSYAALTKIVAIFDFTALAAVIFILRFFRVDALDIPYKKVVPKWRRYIVAFEEEILFGLAFILPFIFVALFFVFMGAFPDYFKASFSQNVGYVGYGNYFIIPQGLLYLKLFLLILGTLLVILYRKKLRLPGILIYTWLFFSLFNAFFSARPYTHYILVLLPSVCLLFGYIVLQKRRAWFHVIVLLFVIVLVYNNFSLYKKIVPYYKNYIDFIWNGKSIEAYQTFFDSEVPRNYEVADFLRANSKKKNDFFLWGDSSTIYPLAGALPPGRYIVAYHITFYPDGFAETRAAIAKKNPKFIIQTKKDPAISAFLSGYMLKYKIQDATVYEKQP